MGASVFVVCSSLLLLSSLLRNVPNKVRGEEEEKLGHASLLLLFLCWLAQEEEKEGGIKRGRIIWEAPAKKG